MFSIVIVSWRNQLQLIDLLKSIAENSFYKHEILIFKNGDNNDERHITDGYKTISSIKNLGLSVGANIISKHATKDFICLVDDDMKVLPNWDKYLLCTHNITKSNWVASTCIESIAPHYNITLDNYTKGIRPKKWFRNISNTPLLIPTKFWKKIGGYDEDFPNVGAELGLAKKAFDCGEIDFIQCPHSLVFHRQSQSMKRLEGIKKARLHRDRVFKKKYGITRIEFIKEIGKGEEYDTFV